MKKWDDNTDKKIRDSLENLDFPFDEASWDKMDAMLNEPADKPVGAFMNKYGYLLMIALLFVSVSTLYSVGSYFKLFERADEETTISESRKAIQYAVINKSDAAVETIDFTSGKPVNQIVSVDSDIKKQGETGSQIIRNIASYSTNGDLAKENRKSKSSNQQFVMLDKENFQDSDYSNSDNQILKSEKTNNLLALKSRITLGSSDGFFGSGGIDDLTLGNDDYKSVSVFKPEKELSKEEKKQQRANAREIRKKLGSSYRKTINNGTGKFSLRPLNWGIRLGIGLDAGELKRKILGSDLYNLNFSYVQGLNVGLYGEYAIRGRWQFQAELAYSRMNQFREYLYLAENTSLQGSRNEASYDFTYTLRSVEFVDFQGVLQYKLPKRGMFELGGAIGWVVPNSSFSGGIAWSSETLRRRPQFLNTDQAIERVNIQTIIGYEYRISRRFSANARYYIGLIDLTNDAFFGLSTLNNFGEPSLLRHEFNGGSRLQVSIKLNLNRVGKKAEKE